MIPENESPEQPMTLADILTGVRSGGVPFTARTFWKYYQLGLLPKGRKLQGRGNVLYFPPQTPQRILWIDVLNKKVGIGLEALAKHREWLDGIDLKGLLRGPHPNPQRFVIWLAFLMDRQGLWRKGKLTPEDVNRFADALTHQAQMAGLMW